MGKLKYLRNMKKVKQIFILERIPFKLFGLVIWEVKLNSDRICCENEGTRMLGQTVAQGSHQDHSPTLSAVPFLPHGRIALPGPVLVAANMKITKAAYTTP